MSAATCPKHMGVTMKPCPYCEEMSRANESAYPIQGSDLAGTLEAQHGLTIREHATIEMAKAMISTAASPCLTGFGGAESAIAIAAAKMADALIAELAKPVTP